MKLKAEILTIDSAGDGITLTLQAKIGRGEWSPVEKQIICIANIEPNRRAFYLGRIVTIEIKP